MSGDCDQFEGRQRAICEGSSGLPCDTENAYRRRWGIAERPCDGRVPPLVTTSTSRPTLLARAWTFSQALTRWSLNGFRRRSQAEIERLATICESCPLYNGTACTSCGCACNAQQIFFNKLAWKSEHCPEGKW